MTGRPRYVRRALAAMYAWASLLHALPFGQMVSDSPVSVCWKYRKKPYIPYADSIPDAAGGFAPDEGRLLPVEIPAELEERIPEDKRTGLRAVLSRDPRPRYQEDPERIYGMGFAGLDVRFQVQGSAVRVVEITEMS